jgi:hypothetical protein
VKNKKVAIAITAIVALVVIVSLLVTSRHWIAHQSYLAAGRGLAAKLAPPQKEKFSSDLAYTLATFWKFYEKGLVSRNDVNDVMEKMSMLRSKKQLADMDVFDFIGYVSRLYTEAMRKHQSDMFPE